jgi:Leucine-rich repeat (LRR) protein
MSQTDAGYIHALAGIKQAAAGRSKSLSLSGLGLTTLPPEIASLTALQTLDLRVNQLTTMLHLLGMDHEKPTFKCAGRDFRLTDVAEEVVKNVLA